MFSTRRATKTPFSYFHNNSGNKIFLKITKNMFVSPASKKRLIEVTTKTTTIIPQISKDFFFCRSKLVIQKLL